MGQNDYLWPGFGECSACGHPWEATTPPARPTLVVMVAADSLHVPRVALIAHDHRKDALLQWAADHLDRLVRCELVATGTTGLRLQRDLGLDVECLRSGPMGGDLQIGARIAEGRLDALVFFWDPLEPQPHDPDVKALLRAATVWDIPTACNRATADLVATGWSRSVLPRARSVDERAFDRASVDESRVSRLPGEDRSGRGDDEGVHRVQRVDREPARDLTDVGVHRDRAGQDLRVADG